MKIIKYIIFSIIVFLLCFSFVTAKENVLEDVVIKEISGEVTAGSFTFDDDIINPTITFKEVNDSVIYELFINYNQELYEIDKIMDDNENEFIKTSYSIIGNKVFMMVKYENAVEKEFILDSIKIQIKLKEVSKDDNSSIINPETGIKTIFPILLILLISVGTIRMIKKKNVFILLFLLIPVLVYAKEDTILEIGLSTENIKIAYTVEFYSGDGVTGSIDDIECIYGEECTLPVNTMEKENNTFKGWSLEPGGEILYLDEAQVLDLISSGKVTLYPVWARLYTIEFNGNGSTSGLMSSIICVEGEECI
ncbi:MAG: InlB B-repeat-containing protein, partial [Bacilli bacterium]|nr:InlB B-repeat-containing protein [Bacilli bacterium]